MLVYPGLEPPWLTTFINQLSHYSSSVLVLLMEAGSLKLLYLPGFSVMEGMETPVSEKQNQEAVFFSKRP